MPIDCPLPDDDPRLAAWNSYKTTEDYANSERWAEYSEVEIKRPHLQGSLWAVFIAGWEAGARHASQKKED